MKKTCIYFFLPLAIASLWEVLASLDRRSQRSRLFAALPPLIPDLRVVLCIERRETRDERDESLDLKSFSKDVLDDVLDITPQCLRFLWSDYHQSIKSIVYLRMMNNALQYLQQYLPITNNWQILYLPITNNWQILYLPITNNWQILYLPITNNWQIRICKNFIRPRTKRNFDPFSH